MELIAGEVGGFCKYHGFFTVTFLYFFCANCRVEEGTPPQDEPKFIVFYSRLLAIFSLFCFNCKEGKPKVSMKRNGTMVTVHQDCGYCGANSFQWKSQPLTLGRYPAGNILLSFGILMAGASVSKVLLVCRHMGLSVNCARTFFKHQTNYLFPVILQHWETYRTSLIDQLKALKGVTWSGDGRFDSMGHCAKYGAYTMFCTTIAKVVHFDLVQVIIFISSHITFHSGTLVNRQANIDRKQIDR